MNPFLDSLEGRRPLSIRPRMWPLLPVELNLQYHCLSAAAHALNNVSIRYDRPTKLAFTSPVSHLCERSIMSAVLFKSPAPLSHYVGPLLIDISGRTYLHIRSRGAAASGPYPSCSSRSLSEKPRQSCVTGGQQHNNTCM